MKVLLVENNKDVIDVLDQEAYDHGFELVVARSKQSAIARLKERGVQLAIFDLQIPTIDEALDEDVAHGMEVLLLSSDLLPGTPRIVWSGRAGSAEYEQIIALKTQGEPYGLADDSDMLEFFNKDDLRLCAQRVSSIAAHAKALGDIPISPAASPIELSESERCVLRIQARRVGGALVKIQEIGGGLSATRTFKSVITNSSGQLLTRTLAKVGDQRRVADEHARFRQYVTGVLDGANFAPFADEVRVGAHGLGGLFYGLVEDFEMSLFGALRGLGDEGAVNLLTATRSATKNWHGERAQAPRQFAEIRRTLLRDELVPEIATRSGIDIATLDSVQVFANAASQHGDLHGDNVLIAQHPPRPVLIDFARTGPAFAALDPITLELSLLFHPDSPLKGGSWPSDAQLGRWAFIDEYVEGCPWPEFVRGCRAWAYEVAAEARELYSLALAFGLRQFRYEDTDKAWASALVGGLHELLLDP